MTGSSRRVRHLIAHLAYRVSFGVAAPLAPQAVAAQSIAPDPVRLEHAADLLLLAHGREPLTLQLSRPLTPSDGELTVLVGSLDLSALASVRGSTIAVLPGPMSIPAGNHTVTLWLRQGEQFIAVGSRPLRVRYRGGFDELSWDPASDITSNGIVAAATSADVTSPPRDQIVGYTLGQRLGFARGTLRFESQATVVGATAAERALTFAQKGARAPRLDLSGYSVTLSDRGTQVELGHLALGSARHLVSGFASRGAQVKAGPSWARVSVGSVAGAQLVGWDNPLGLASRDHRLLTMGVDLDLLRRRPGLVQVRVHTLQGALQPRPGFTQGAVTDAEESRGTAWELSLATPGQRARLTAGYTRSAFVNPLRDAQLTDSLAVAPLSRDTRGARFLEATWTALQGARLGAVPVSATLGARHERVDPLFRSVGAFAQADRDQTAMDLNTTVGPVSAQASLSRGRDNLLNVGSLLTSHTRGATLSLSASVAALLGLRSAPWALPAVSFAVGSTHQFAAAPPASGDFRSEDLANQRSTTLNATAQWQRGGWMLGLRHAGGLQDNRQPTREAADFRTRSTGGTLNRTIGARADVMVEHSDEAQQNMEAAQTSTVRRVGITANWRPRNGTALGGNLTVARSRTPPATGHSSALEDRLELSQQLFGGGNAPRAPRGQLFLRSTRSLQRVAPLFVPDGDVPAALPLRRQWSLSSGLSLTLW